MRAGGIVPCTTSQPGMSRWHPPGCLGAYFADSEIGRSGGSHSGRLCTHLSRRVIFRRMDRVYIPRNCPPTICALPAHDRPTIPITRLTQLPRVPTWERQLNSDAEGEQSDASTSGRRLDPIVPWQILVPKVPWTLVRGLSSAAANTVPASCVPCHSTFSVFCQDGQNSHIFCLLKAKPPLASLPY